MNVVDKQCTVSVTKMYFTLISYGSSVSNEIVLFEHMFLFPSFLVSVDVVVLKHCTCFFKAHFVEILTQLAHVVL